MKEHVVKWGTWRDSAPYALFSSIPLFVAYTIAFDEAAAVHPAIAIVPLVIGLGLVLSFFSRALNRTRVFSDGKRIRSQTSPIPLGGQIDLAMDDFVQFALMKRSASTGNSATSSYFIGVELQSGEMIKVFNSPVTSSELAQRHVGELNTIFTSK